jgi:oxygen-independent coproporphyrinogen-3 oxidase
MLTSLYVHIPFCNHICTYCDFHKELATSKKKENYINALINELHYHKDKFTDIKTVYIGGGTPSALDVRLLERLFKTINSVIDLNNVVEYTIETNPNDITGQFVQLITSYHINRVSIGVQTFNPKHLQFLGRTHNKNDVLTAISLLREYGIMNISIDMIFSLINQTDEELLDDLNEVSKLDIDHISYYSLILEEKTKLYYLYEKDEIDMNTEDLEGSMYMTVINYLTNIGFDHYEISNFSKNGLESEHNKAYWLNKEYLGIGSGSHSLYAGKRFNTVRNVSKYIENCKNLVFEEYNYYPYDRISDGLIFGLRLMKGINIEDFNKKYNTNVFVTYPELHDFIKNGVLQYKEGYLSFTKEGVMIGNEVFKIFVEVL